MTTPTETPRSRRALLTAGLAAGVATVASAVGRVAPVQAAVGDPIIAGVPNSVNGTTSLIIGDGEMVFVGLNNADNGVCLKGASENWSTSQGGTGVQGSSNNLKGFGVRGIAYPSSSNTTGVYGETNSPDGVGVAGSSGAVGAGVGVIGTSKSNAGVFGKSETSNGVSGTSVSGNGVYATTSGSGSALNVAGKAKFSRSGRATVAANRSYADITVAGGLTSHSVIHATLQTYRSGVSIAAVRANYPTAGKARIYLTKVASTTAITYVGWFVAEY